MGFRSVMVVFLSLVGLIAAYSIQSPRAICPNTTTQVNFNLTRYLGGWYENQKFVNVFQDGLTCVRATYTQPAKGAGIDVFNEGVLESGEVFNVTGIGKQNDPVHPGNLTVYFPGRPGGKYWVLETDYDNYSAVYSCAPLGAGKMEFAWLLTRTNTASKNVTDKALAAFTRNGVDVTKFKKTVQENCKYSN